MAAKPAFEIPNRLKENLESFTGRTWLLPRLLEWFQDTDERIFLLSGGPGSGKSTLMAWLAGHGRLPGEALAQEQLSRLRQQVGAVHFCQAASRNVSPGIFAENVANQLAQSNEDFSEALALTVGEKMQVSVTQNITTIQQGATNAGVMVNLGSLGDEQGFEQAFVRPLIKLYDNGYDQPLVVLVDALDEAETWTGRKLSYLLSRLPGDLPPQVRILASTRNDPRILKHFRSTPKCDLVEDAPADQNDIERYAWERLSTSGDELEPGTIEHIAGLVSQKANGIFLYAVMALNNLPSHLGEIPDVDSFSLPDGLSGLYLEFLNREIGLDEERWYARLKPVLGLIAVSQGDGLTRSQLRQITGIEVDDLLRVSKQYLVGNLPEGPFRFFHQSFVDFLFDEDENIDYLIDEREMHQKIADHYWDASGEGTQKCDDYGMDQLSVHLYVAEQDDRLKKLITPAWMRLRFEQRGRTYDGFLIDVEYNWMVVYEEAKAQIEAGERVEAIGENVHFALIRSSINSLASNYIPELIAQAVRTETWLPARAVSVILHMVSSAALIKLIVDLLESAPLSADQRKTLSDHVGKIVQAIKEGGNEGDLVEAIEAQLPLLPGDQMEPALEAARSIKDPYNRMKALSALAARLAEAEREAVLTQALEAALSIEYAYDQVEALTTLAPQLTSGQLEKALPAAQALTYNLDRVKVITALILHLPEGQRLPALEPVLAEVLSIEEEYELAEALEALGPHLSGEQLESAFAAAQHLTHELDRVKAVTALVPQLSGERREVALERALAAVFEIEYEPDQVDALTTLLPHLSEVQRGAALERALAAVLEFEYEIDRVDALAALVPHLPQAGREAAIESALEAAVAIEEAYDRVKALNALALHLPMERREAAIESALEAALAIENSYDREEALSALGPNLSGDRLERAVSAAQEIEEAYDRVKALNALALHLPEERREATLEAALEAALAIDEEYDQAEALTALAPYLEGEKLESALEAVLAMEYEEDRVEILTSLTPHLSGDTLEKALSASLAIEDQPYLVDALAALAPHLPEAHQKKVLETALKAVLALEDTYEKVDTLAALAPQLSGSLLEQALEAALKLKDEYDRVDALVALAPRLPSELLERALNTVLAFEEAYDRVEALIELAPYLSGDPLERALNAALTLEEYDRAEVLTALAPRLSEAQMERALAAAPDLENELNGEKAQITLNAPLSEEQLEQKLEESLAIEYEEDKVTALAALISQLPQERRDAAVQPALSAALEITYEEERVEALKVLAPYLSGEQQEQALSSALTIDYEADRVKALEALTPHLREELQEQALAAAFEMKEEINRVAALAALLPNLSEARQEEILNAIQEDEAIRFEDKGYKIETLVKLLPSAREHDSVVQTIRQEILELIYNEPWYQEREYVLSLIAIPGLFAPPVFDPDTIQSIAESVLEICCEWHWA